MYKGRGGDVGGVLFKGPFKKSTKTKYLTYNFVKKKKVFENKCCVNNC